MTPERWQDVKAALDRLAGLGAEERALALAELRALDAELAGEAESLLAAHPPESFLQSPAVTPPQIEPGMRFGPYEVLELLGRGGMGDVWRARDTTLRRDVALKMLPVDVAQDPIRLARLRKEAQVLASLNHPYVGTIYGFEGAGPTPALVLELVQGQTLATRLSRGPLPVRDALRLAGQIAEALEAAHELGIVHRDLKPGNVMLRPDGTVKVLDFGLATLGPEHTDTAATTLALTQPGTVMGTPAYMSPEQARGKGVDKRADIWAFGCVVFEMLTGHRPFRGETASDVLAAILQSEPDWGRLPADARATVEPLLKRCLKKDPVDRFREIADARFLLEEGPADRVPALTRVPMLRRRERVAWLAALATVMLGTLVAWTTRQPEALAYRLDITTPPTTRPESVALSPDGRTLAFVASSEGKSRLWLRRLDDTVVRVLDGTENARLPFWSPNNREIAFSVESDLKRIDLDNGAVQAVAPLISGAGGAWLPDNSLLVTPNPGSPLMRVPVTGGQATPVTKQRDRFFGHSFPHLLPDGRHFLFLAGDDGGLYAGSLADTNTQKILDASRGVYAPTGHLLFVQKGMLYSQSFDATRRTLTGDRTLVAQAPNQLQEGITALSVSAAGPIAYRTGGSATRRRLVWVDRAGKELEVLSEINQMAGQGTALSEDDRFIAWTDSSNDLLLFEVARRLFKRFTFETTVDMHPLWAPGGQRLVYSANANPGGLDFDLFMKSTVGSDGPERLLRAPVFEGADDWSEDGKFVLYTSVKVPAENLSPSEIWALPMDGTREPFQVVRTAASQQCESWYRCVAASGQFSPRGGKWIAFQSNESNQFEIYIQPFPKGDKVQISVGGGVQARWRRDGKELFYIGSDNQLMAVSVDLESGKPGVPEPLFTPQWSMNPHHPQIRNFSVSRDGRFLIDVLRETVSPITVILNWKPKS